MPTPVASHASSSAPSASSSHPTLSCPSSGQHSSSKSSSIPRPPASFQDSTSRKRANPFASSSASSGKALKKEADDEEEAVEDRKDDLKEMLSKKSCLVAKQPSPEISKGKAREAQIPRLVAKALGPAKPAPRAVSKPSRVPEGPLSRSQMIKKLVSTVSDPTNLITNQSGQKPLDVVVSASTGHQVKAYGPGSDWEKNYNKIRVDKLRKQAEGKSDDYLKGVHAYVGSNTVGSGITDLELKRLINLHGGSISTYPNSLVTHILTSQALSSSKNQDLFTKTKGWKPKVVHPDWAVECEKAQRRLPLGKWEILGGGANQATLNFAPVTSASSSTSSVPSARKATSAPPLSRASGSTADEAILLDDD